MGGASMVTDGTSMVIGGADGASIVGASMLTVDASMTPNQPSSF
jgi:hypothetical protein